MNPAILKTIDRLLTMASKAGDEMEIALLGIAGELLEAELDRVTSPVACNWPGPLKDAPLT